MSSVERARTPRRTTFLDLPDELILQLLYYISPEDTIHFGRTSQRLNDITNTDLLWRHHCLISYKYWHPRHRIGQIDIAPSNNTDWKRLFEERRQGQDTQRRLFESVIGSVVGRNEAIGELAAYGADARDVLLVYAADKKYLSKSYWANVVLSQISRASGIATWSSMLPRATPPPDSEPMLEAVDLTSPPVAEYEAFPRPSLPAPEPEAHNPSQCPTPNLEQAIGAFDCFVSNGTSKSDHAHEPRTDASAHLLDGLAERLLVEHSSILNYPPQQRALTIATYLHERGFRGVRDDNDYHNLQNNFLRMTLSEQQHEGLPLIYAVIFCALAGRVGLEAHPTNFPMHVYAVVTGAKTITENDSTDSPTITTPLEEPIYVNPFTPDPRYFIIDKTHLHALLREMGIYSDSFPRYLAPATNRDLVLRTTHNILRSLQLWHQQTIGMPRFRPRQTTPTTNDALYAFLWASILLGPDSRRGGSTLQITLSRGQCLLTFAEHLSSKLPWDMPLVEKYMLPSIYALPEAIALRETIAELKRRDSIPPIAKRRGSELAGKVKYRIGQVFRHRRYGYQGVVRGWSASCEADEEWMVQMRIDDLGGGREQGFYNAMVEDGSDRYVAEENIEVVHDAPADEILEAAGRYFHYYDEEKRCFISNIKEEYPYD